MSRFISKVFECPEFKNEARFNVRHSLFVKSENNGTVFVKTTTRETGKRAGNIQLASNMVSTVWPCLFFFFF